MENAVVTRTLHKDVSWEEFQIFSKMDIDSQMLQKLLHTFEDMLSSTGKLYRYPNIPERTENTAVRAFGSPRMGKIYGVLDTSPLFTASRGIIFSEKMLAICDGKTVHHISYNEITGVYPEDRTVPFDKGTIVFRKKDGECKITMDGLNKKVLAEILNRSVKKLVGKD